MPEIIDMSEATWLRKFLNVYWLRPENALWRANNCKILEDIEFTSPSLDLSCGDGVFSFLLAGGEFEDEFDIFGAVDNLDQFFDDEDIYNAYSESYDPAIKSRPNYQITVGTDWKADLLAKAETLDLHEKLIQHDNNEPLPFEDNRFQTVFSNSVYWVDNLDTHLNEIRRVLDDSGKAVLVLKTTHIRNFLQALWDDWKDELGNELIDMIDRGRKDHYAHLYDDVGWTARLEDAGLSIKDRYPSASQFHGRVWDLGLRPISPHLIKMAYSLPSERRVELKTEWIDTWYDLLEPFNYPQFDITERPPAEIIYVVEQA